MLQWLIDFVRNAEPILNDFIQNHGAWVYALTFGVIFAETGLVVCPFLPGDSLLFVIGTFCAKGSMDLWLTLVLLIVAAILGDAVNYHLGKFFGPRVFRGEGLGLWGKLLNRKHLDRANAFYEKYGGKAVILGRFVPIVRTFVPFVAGAGAMNYQRFVVYNVLGAVLWVGICTIAGYYFGGLPWVKKNFEIVVLGIIVVSVLPIVIELLLAWKRGHAAKAAVVTASGGEAEKN